jgi:hypothetical protein
LPVTAALASSCLGLPFYLDLDDEAIHRIADALAVIQVEQTANALQPLLHALESAEQPAARTHV